MKNFTIFNRLQLSIVFVFLFARFDLSAQQTEFQPTDFEYVTAKTDTLYLSSSEEVADSYKVFKTKEEVIYFLDNQYLQSEKFITGYSERNYEYEIRVNQTEAAYYSKNTLELDESNKEDYKDSLTREWNVPVNVVATSEIYGIYKIKINEKDWKRKEFLDKLNGYIKKAYGENPPVYFGYEAVYVDGVKSVNWVEVNNLLVNREKREAVITTQSGREILFGFTDEQYTHIASIHVQFLAF